MHRSLRFLVLPSIDFYPTYKHYIYNRKLSAYSCANIIRIYPVAFFPAQLLNWYYKLYFSKRTFMKLFAFNEVSLD